MLSGLPPEKSFTVTRELLLRFIDTAFLSGAAAEQRNPGPRI